MYLYDSFEAGYKELLGARFLVCTLKCPNLENQTYSNYVQIWSNQNFKILDNRKAVQFVSLSSNFGQENRIKEFGKNVNYSSEINSAESSEKITESGQKCAILNVDNQSFSSISARVFCREEDYLIVSAFDDGNWSASRNGKAAQLQKMENNLVYVRLEKGMNSVSIDHKSQTRDITMYISLIGLLIYNLLFAFIKRNRLKIKAAIRGIR
jgi:hypothetical protein